MRVTIAIIPRCPLFSRVETLIEILQVSLKNPRIDRCTVNGLYIIKIQNNNKCLKDVRDRSAIMVCEVKFGAKILPAYSPLGIKVKQQLQTGENASLYVIE